MTLPRTRHVESCGVHSLQSRALGSLPREGEEEERPLLPGAMQTRIEQRAFLGDNVWELAEGRAWDLFAFVQCRSRLTWLDEEVSLP